MYHSPLPKCLSRQTVLFSRLEIARAEAGNDMIKHMQIVFPIVTSIQVKYHTEVIKKLVKSVLNLLHGKRTIVY